MITDEITSAKCGRQKAKIPIAEYRIPDKPHSGEMSPDGAPGIPNDKVEASPK